MPYENLIPFGYSVNRSEDGLVAASIQGHGISRAPAPGANEEAIVTELANHAALQDKLIQARDYFSGNYANWPTMTAAQKDAANRQAQRALANIARFLLNDLSSSGD